jgi:hypothetical protein
VRPTVVRLLGGVVVLPLFKHPHHATPRFVVWGFLVFANIRISRRSVLRHLQESAVPLG